MAHFNNKFIGLLLAIGILCGCTAGPNYTRPNLSIPEKWSTDELPAKAGLKKSLESWWKKFNDPVLTKLIQKAMKHNLNLKQAIARIDESRAMFQAVTGEKLPGIGVSGAILRGKESENAFPINVPGGMPTETTYSVGMFSSWEIDLFGRIRRKAEAAYASYEASIEDFHGVLVSLTAEIANVYIKYREYQHRLALANERLRYLEKIRDLVAKSVEAGTASEVELSDAEAKVAEVKAEIFKLKNGLIISKNRLCNLLGLTPGSLDELLQDLRPIPEPPSEIIISIPADVVRQRPDIRRAERQLAAQTAMIGIRASDLYPRLHLFGSFKFASFSVKDLLESASLGFNFGPTLTWKIFQGGTVRALVKVEEAKTRQALAVYENTLINAFEEVENAISTYVKSSKQLEMIKQIVQERRRALSLIQQLYKFGKQDYQSVLRALIAVNIAEDQQVFQKAKVAQSLVNLYRALGGGWSEEQV